MDYYTQEITPQELQEALLDNKKLLIIDVREPHEFNLCKISDSINFPLTILPEQWHQIDLNADIVTLCHHGIRSLKAAAFLKQKGAQHVKSLKGGIDAWTTLIDPTLQRY